MQDTHHQLFILTDQDDVYHSLIEAKHLPGLCITTEPDKANIVLAAPPMARERLGDLPSLEWLQSIYAGVDALCVPPLSDKIYQLTNVKDIFGPQITEYVLGYSISFYRHFRLYQAQQDSQLWSPHLYQGLQGKTLVTLGTGSIASYLAQVAKAFGLEVLGVNRSGIPPKDSPFSQVFHVGELEAALGQADIVVNTLPATPETRGILHSGSLGQCHNALLFNVGRGSALVESDLIWALDNQHLAHAYLDVFEQEPMTDPVLWSHPKITVTPHIAALSFPEQVVEIFSQNYRRWCDGFGLKFVVDQKKGY